MSIGGDILEVPLEAIRYFSDPDRTRSNYFDIWMRHYASTLAKSRITGNLQKWYNRHRTAN
jgi:hypothetical protein